MCAAAASCPQTIFATPAVSTTTLTKHSSPDPSPPKIKMSDKGPSAKMGITDEDRDRVAQE